MTALLAGLAFGLVGSGHCAAMCGPLVVLANPKRSWLGIAAPPSPSQLAVHALLYHCGRVLTYLLLGAVVGLAGSAMTQLGFGRALAVGAGAALLLQALAVTGVVPGRVRRPVLASSVTRALGGAGAWMRVHRVQGPILFGVLNGLLPCGLLYAALTAAAGFGHVRLALVFMGAFAFGTMPVLALIGLASGSLATRVPWLVRRAAPVALAVVGVLLIARGVSTPHGAHGRAASGSPAVSSAHPPHVH